MATYFGYVEREADSYINWADVGRNMSATIDNIQRVRDEKKALIEKAYREDLDYIQSRPAGEHETLNAWSLNFGNTSAENLKLKYNMLKQGKISVNDFVTFRQNLTDSVEKIYTVNNQLQEAFKKVNDRTKAGDNQEIERATKVLLEKYGALENTLPYINSLTGSVAIGLTEMVEEDGKQVRKLRQGDDAYLTPAQLQAASMQEFNNFDPEPVLNTWVKNFGKVKDSIRRIGGEDFSGMITSIQDIKGERWKQLAKENKLSEEQIAQIQGFIDKFNASESEFVNGVLENPFDASAILTERMGTVEINGQPVPYEVVFNEKDQTGDDKLYVEKTKEGKFIPRFDTEIGKKQKKALQEYLKGQLYVKYDRIVEQQPYAEQRKERPIIQGGGSSSSNRAYGDDLDTYKTYLDYIKELRIGTPDVKESRMQWLTSLPGVDQTQTYYDADKDELVVYSSDPNKPYPFKYKFGDKISNEDFVIQLSGLVLPKETARFGKYLKNADFSGAENPNLPLGGLIRNKENEIEDLKYKNEEITTQGMYDVDIAIAEKELAKLKERQAAQKRAQGNASQYND